MVPYLAYLGVLTASLYSVRIALTVSYGWLRSIAIISGKTPTPFGLIILLASVYSFRIAITILLEYLF
jgi:hypothetical protein